MSAPLYLGLIALLGPQLVTSLYPSSSKIDCNDGGFYIRADPDNCSNFYVCDHGNPVLFHCPSGLYFNPAIHVCDWPRNVHCIISKQSTGQQSNQGEQQYSHNNQKPYYADQQSGAYNNGGQQSNQGEQQYSHNNQKPYYANQQSGAYNNGDQQSNQGEQQYSHNNQKPYYADQQSGAHNNGDQQSYGNNDEQQYDSENSGNGNPSSGQQYSSDGTNHNQGNNHLLYPVQPVQEQPSDTSVGPSLTEPHGPVEDRPRPTIDQLASASGNPYQEYLNQNQNQNIDIR